MAIDFDCERVNLTLVDRFRKVFFRITYDQYDEQQKVTSFPLDNSIAGYTALSCHSMFSDSVQTEQRFGPDIDDPKGDLSGNNPAHQILSCPVFCQSDHLSDDAGASEELGKLPRAVIQLINKRHNRSFT